LVLSERGQLGQLEGFSIIYGKLIKSYQKENSFALPFVYCSSGSTPELIAHFLTPMPRKTIVMLKIQGGQEVKRTGGVLNLINYTLYVPPVAHYHSAQLVV